MIAACCKKPWQRAKEGHRRPPGCSCHRGKAAYLNLKNRNGFICSGYITFLPLCCCAKLAVSHREQRPLPGVPAVAESKNRKGWLLKAMWSWYILCDSVLFWRNSAPALCHRQQNNHWNTPGKGAHPPFCQLRRYRPAEIPPPGPAGWIWYARHGWGSAGGRSSRRLQGVLCLFTLWRRRGKPLPALSPNF